MQKQCFKCKQVKLLSEFYSHPQMGDKHLGKCKDCTKKDTFERTSRLSHDPVWVAKERERCRIKTNLNRDKSKCTPAARKRWDLKNKVKKKAHSKASRAVKNGQIPKRTECEACGAKGRLHKHHPDYALPLLVVWLCPKCHGIAHRKPFGTPIGG